MARANKGRTRQNYGQPKESAFKRTDYEYDYHDYMNGGKFDIEKLRSDARKLAKRANQRLVRLEKAGLTNSPAYRGAVKALSGEYSGEAGQAVFASASKSGLPRYKENVKGLTAEQLQRELWALQRTLTAQTSTRKGTEELFKRELEEFKKRFSNVPGTEGLTTNDLLDIFKDKSLKEALKAYGYRSVMRTISGYLKQSPDYEEMILAEAEEDSEEDYNNARRTRIEEAKEAIKEAVSKGINVADLERRLGIKAPKNLGLPESV